MSGTDVVIVGLGMVTAVGLGTRETAASVRAGVMRFTETTWHDAWGQPFTVAEVPDEALPERDPSLADRRLAAREARLLRLATRALVECLEVAGPALAPPALVLALPDMETARPLDRPEFLRCLGQQLGGKFDTSKSWSDLKGRAGGLVAIGRAGDAIRAGVAPFMLAGAVDTYRDLYVLGTLDREGRVKSSRHLDGFVPGEGAAFVLLAARHAAEAAGLAALAWVSAVAEGFETGHLYSDVPYLGEGLSSALQALRQAAPPSGPIGAVFSSMNGEHYWAKEWGVAFLRNHAAFDAGHSLHHPADCYGDTGAASGPLMVGLAANDIGRRRVRSPALVYGSSDHGQRAVLTVSAL